MKITMPPGFYRIGDPCYSIADWEEFLSSFWAAGDRGGLFEHDGVKVVCCYTAYGDGCYDFEGLDIPVDAGCIAALPESVCTKDDGGWVPWTFKREWTFEYDGETFKFDGMPIYTGDEDERHGDYCEHCGR